MYRVGNLVKINVDILQNAENPMDVKEDKYINSKRTEHLKTSLYTVPIENFKIYRFILWKTDNLRIYRLLNR